jgi:transposase
MKHSDFASSNQWIRIESDMRFYFENLPSDKALLHRLVREMVVVVDSRDGEIESLQSIIKQL